MCFGRVDELFRSNADYVTEILISNRRFVSLAFRVRESTYDFRREVSGQNSS